MGRAGIIAAAIGLLLLGINAMTKPRGIRNHNPGNIEKGANWVGLADTQPEGRYAAFTKPEYGIRAIARILRTYRTAYGLETIAGIISRWAPPSENPTAEYIAFVSERVGAPADALLYFSDELVADLISAIIHFENGQQPYSRKTLLAGIELERTA